MHLNELEETFIEDAIVKRSHFAVFWCQIHQEFIKFYIKIFLKGNKSVFRIVFLNQGSI